MSVIICLLFLVIVRRCVVEKEEMHVDILGCDLTSKVGDIMPGSAVHSLTPGSRRWDA